MEFRTGGDGKQYLPTVCDKLNVVASVHNRKLIEALVNQSKQKDIIIQDLENKIIELQYKSAYQDNRLTVLENKINANQAN